MRPEDGARSEAGRRGEIDGGLLHAPGSAAALRRAAFVEAVRGAFFERGYSATTMSAIAAEVGGSKTTLWSYFPAKEGLFEAVVDDLVERYGEALTIDLDLDAPAAEVLRRFADVLTATSLTPPLLALFRLVVAEADRFPHLAQTYYERGPRRGKERLAAWMAARMAKGDLRRGDPMLAVHQFVGLLQAATYQLAILGIRHDDETSRLEEEKTAGVRSFLSAWGRPALPPN